MAVFYLWAATIKFTLTILIIVVGLAGRSTVDKFLTLQGGAELVALWAQLGSIIEMVAGVAGAGVGTGLVVYVARAMQPGRQREILAEALKISLTVTLPVAAAAGAAGYAWSDLLTGGKVAPWVFVLTAAVGWIVVVPVLVNNYWMGRKSYWLMLALCIASVGIALLAVISAPPGLTLEFLALANALPAVVILMLRNSRSSPRQVSRRPHPLRRYVVPGLAIGILSPVSMVISRGAIGDAVSWHDAGVLQAMFRVTDWICALAGGVLSLIHLPRLAAARSGPKLNAEIRSAAKAVLLPSAIAFAALALLHRPVFNLLYDASVHASDAAVALFFAGSLMRIASWIPLFALYSMRRTREITIGEFLSLPLFAALVLLAGKHLSLELAGAFWLLSYLVYGAYNLLAVRRHQQKSPTP